MINNLRLPLLLSEVPFTAIKTTPECCCQGKRIFILTTLISFAFSTNEWKEDTVWRDLICYTIAVFSQLKGRTWNKFTFNVCFYEGRNKHLDLKSVWTLFLWRESLSFPSAVVLVLTNKGSLQASIFYFWMSCWWSFTSSTLSLSFLSGRFQTMLALLLNFTAQW